MAGFFSLGNNSIHNKTSINSYLWHYYHHLQLHHQHSISAVDSQDHEITRSEDNNNSNPKINNNLMMMRMSSSGSGSGSGSGGSISCQDCGNQAKKDCIYMRCRTCCKSQGFDCATHVKSTWVPASVRRERHQKLLQGNIPADHQQDQQMLGIHSKRRRDNNNNNNNNNSNNNNNNNNPSSSSLVCTQLPLTTTNISSFSGGMEVGNFPAEVNYPATFRCVKVSSMDDNEEEYAYQTAVNIGGHVFKGILYDQGPDHPNQQVGTSSPTYALGGGRGESSTMGPTTSMGGPAPAMPTSSSQNVGYLDPSYYPLPLNAYLPPGTPFFPNPRP